MSAGKLTWGRRDWLGLMVLFLSSIAADVIGALLAVKGILPMGSVAAWVYGGWALGAFLGVRVAIRWWIGESRRRKPCKSAMTGVMTSVGCIRFTTAAPAGAARCRALGSCESSGSITRSYGSGCGKWTNVRWHSSVPARWGNSRRIGAWNDWSSDLRQKRSSFLFHPCRRSVSDDVSRTE